MTFIRRFNIRGIDSVTAKSRQDGNYLEDCNNVFYDENNDCIISSYNVENIIINDFNIYPHKGLVSKSDFALQKSYNGIIFAGDGPGNEQGGIYYINPYTLTKEKFPSFFKYYYLTTSGTSLKISHFEGHNEVIYFSNPDPIYSTDQTIKNSSITKLCNGVFVEAGIPGDFILETPSQVSNNTNISIPSSSWNHVDDTFITTANLSSVSRVRITTNGTLPDGIISNTDYFLFLRRQEIISGVTYYYYSLTLYPAQLNTIAFSEINSFVDFTTSGTGTHTINFIAQQAVSNVSLAVTFTLLCHNGEEITSCAYLDNFLKNASILSNTNFCLSFLYKGFNGKFFYTRGASVAIPENNNLETTGVTDTEFTVNLKTIKNVYAGSYLYFRTVPSTLTSNNFLLSNFVPLKVKSVSSTQIVVENPDKINIYKNICPITNIIATAYMDIGNTGVFRYHTSFPITFHPEYYLGNAFSGSILLGIHNIYTSLAGRDVLVIDENESLPPPSALYTTIFKDVLVLGNCYINGERRNSSICFSDVDSANYHREKFDASYNEIVIGKKDEGDITGLYNFNNELIYIFKRKAIYTLSGDIYRKSIVINKICDYIGCVHSESIASYNRNIFFLAHDGVYSIYSGSNVVTKISSKINDKILLVMNGSFSEINFYPRIKVSSCIDNSVPRYFLYIENVDNQNNLFFAYNIKRRSWWKMAINANAGLFSVENNVYGASTAVFGCLYKLTGYSSNNKYIESSWETADMPEMQKKFKNLKLFFSKKNTCISGFTIKIYTDWNDTPVTVLQNQSIDGDMTYEFRFDGGIRQCKSIKFSIENQTTDKIFALEGWSIEYEPIYFESKKF